TTVAKVYSSSPQLATRPSWISSTRSAGDPAADAAGSSAAGSSSAGSSAAGSSAGSSAAGSSAAGSSAAGSSAAGCCGAQAASSAAAIKRIAKMVSIRFMSGFSSSRTVYVVSTVTSSGKRQNV